MKYQEINSAVFVEHLNFISNKNQGEFNDLLLLWGLMHQEKLSRVEGKVYFRLRNQYSDLYLKLLKEIAPVQYHLFLEEQLILSNDAVKQNDKTLEQQKMVQQERNDYFEWLSLQQRA
jgi:hypothetical protein